MAAKDHDVSMRAAAAADAIAVYRARHGTGRAGRAKTSCRKET